MRLRVKSGRLNFPELAFTYLPPTLITIFLWATSENDVSVWSVGIALVLLCLPWFSYQEWRKTDREELPLFAMISSIYWLYYGFPLFWGERTVLQAVGNDLIISEGSINLAMVMVLLGVLSLKIGLRSKLGQRLKPKHLPYITLNQSRLNYLRAILCGGIVLNLFDISPYAFGESGRQIVLTFITLIPTVAFAILFREYFRGNSSRLDKAIIATFLLVRFVVGISSGWLGVFISVIVICAAIYITERRKIPALIVTLAVFSMLFFQVGKEEFRKTYWKTEEQTGKIERIEFWVNASMEKWSDAVNDPSGKTLKDATYPSISRVALLTQAANVIDLTPSVVPYQYGRLYSYLAVGLIPRFFWPDKPSVNEANQFYQIAYGISTEDDLTKVSIAIGILTESFMNFGWFGVIPVMFLLGVFLDFFKGTFLGKSSGLLMNGIGFVLLPQFLAIESQLAAYMGGIIQSFVLITLVMLPIITFNRSNHPTKTQPILIHN